jgi:hypothetical protein
MRICSLRPSLFAPTLHVVIVKTLHYAAAAAAAHATAPRGEGCARTHGDSSCKLKAAAVIPTEVTQARAERRSYM